MLHYQPFLAQAVFLAEYAWLASNVRFALGASNIMRAVISVYARIIFQSARPTP